MPDESRGKSRKDKHRDSSPNEEFKHRKKKSKHSKSRDETEIRIVTQPKRVKPPEDVIEIHASSSDDNESSEMKRNRHKRHKSEVEQASVSKSADKKETKEENHSRSHSDDHNKKQHSRERGPEVRVKDEKEEEERKLQRSRNRDGRSNHRRSSPNRQRHLTTERHNDDRHNNRDGQRGRPRSDRPSRRGEEREDFDWGRSNNSEADVKKEPIEKAKPDFKLSGKLTEERNTYKGVVIKYSEPPEARVPKKRWRLYQFKGEESLPTLYIHRQSAFLIGRDRKIADLPVDHPSCSKQHAALQYRLINYERPNGSVGKQIRLYVIDLESANGTFINGNKIEPKRYVELMEKDVLKFGFSSREYVLLHEHSKGDESSSESGDNAE